MSLQKLNDQYASFLLDREVQSQTVRELSAYCGKTVLITGAGGSIGSHLAKQLLCSGARVVLLDRDETALQETTLLLEASHRETLHSGTKQPRAEKCRGGAPADVRHQSRKKSHQAELADSPLQNVQTVLADIRDAKLLRRVFKQVRPQVVLHAAALKHVQLLQQFPAEAWRTNVVGTYNVLQAALGAKAQTLVNISTDKAAAPISVLGKTKFIAERLVTWAATQTGRKYFSVRFGNVLGSRGSLLPLLEQRIALGLPLLVRDPQATRYFMTVAEACGLALDAAQLDVAGKIAVLDMGEPVRIADLVQRVVQWHKADAAVINTQLCAGEKQHEQLTAATEKLQPTTNPQIFYTAVDPLPPKKLDQQRSELLSWWSDSPQLRHARVA